MGKVFVSYAEEDSEVAIDLANCIRAAGLDVYYWQDPLRRGKQFISTIEKEINQANIFLAIMSPHFLASFWCNCEREMALRRSASLSAKNVDFIVVAQVVPVEYNKAGFLANFDWYDLTGKNRESETNILMNKLKSLTAQEIPLDERNHVQPKWPTFQNRREELDDLLSNLLNTAGDRFFLLLAGPKMGKTWLLDQLPLELTEKDSKWKILRINLHEQPLSVRCDSEKLLSAYFGNVFENCDQTERARSVARLIAKSERSWLLLLDNAELLSNEVAKDFRKFLSDIHKFIIERGKNIDIRLAYVAASRAQLKSWRGVIPKPRFHIVELTPFNRGVIINALREMTEVDKQKIKGLGNSWYSKTSQALEKATEGLPQLLMAYMQWIREDQYFTTEKEILSQELFDKLAVPYVENYLLSKDSLFPFDTPAKNIREKEKILQAVLLKLSPYRQLSESHLEKFLVIDYETQELLDQLNWQVRDLWIALSKTYIVGPTFTVLHQIYPAIRRLLFRYQFRDDVAQKLAHKQARQFMGNWWREISGTDRSLYLIESLWHLSEYNRLLNNENSCQHLVEWIQQTFEEALEPNHTSVGDLAMFITNRIGEDEELQHSLEFLKSGLFSQILAIIDKIDKLKEDQL
jgi:hypothetical protein